MAIEHPLKISKHDSFNLMATSTNGESSRGYSRYISKGWAPASMFFPWPWAVSRDFQGLLFRLQQFRWKIRPAIGGCLKIVSHRIWCLQQPELSLDMEKKRASTLQSQWDPIWEDKKPDCHFWWVSTYSKSSSTKLNPSTDFRRVQLILSDQLHVTWSA